MYDEDGFFDVPAGFRDADIEQAAYEAEGNRIAALHAQGICTHGWTQGYTPDHRPDLKPGQVACLEEGCGLVFETEDAWWAAREDALA